MSNSKCKIMMTVGLTRTQSRLLLAAGNRLLKDLPESAEKNALKVAIGKLVVAREATAS